MTGAGKSACARELLYHFKNLDRFTRFVFFKAPDKDQDISAALANFAIAFETQVREQDQALFPLTAAPQSLRQGLRGEAALASPGTRRREHPRRAR